MNRGLLFQPLKPFIIHQKFGENRACRPLDGSQKVITCDGNNPPEGWKSLYGPNGHPAIDLRAKHGQEVYAAQTGDVYMIDTKERSGLDVRIESVVEGRRLRHTYEHLMGYQVRVGDHVTVGQVIGWADNTGWSSGDHLHFKVEEYIDGKWVIIDPLSVMSTRFALDALATQNTIKYIAELTARLFDRWGDYIRNKSK